MITYQDIYDALRKEKYAEQLQSLPKNFLKEFSEYIKEKRNISEKENEMFSDAIAKTKKQMENAFALIKELVLRRKKKILSLALIASETGISKRDFENMLEYEKELFGIIVKQLEDAEKKILSAINGHDEEKLLNKLIRFKDDVDAFLDAEGKEIGPFKKGEVANLPLEISSILVEDKKAAFIESE